MQPPTTTAAVHADLLAEWDVLDRLVEPLDAARWRLATRSPGWTVSDQIGHLAYGERVAALAIVDPPRFIEYRDRIAHDDPPSREAHALGPYRQLAQSEQLAQWRAARDELDAAARTLHDADRIEWFGPPMGAASFVTARLMEAWAHGQDIVDAVAPELGADPAALRPDTDRIRHIAELGVRTRSWSYRIRGESRPDVPVRVSLTAPSGAIWEWTSGAGATDTGATGTGATGTGAVVELISGPAADFCRVVTRRRRVGDTQLTVRGAAAADWMAKAQAFAGAPSPEPQPWPPADPSNPSRKL